MTGSERSSRGRAEVFRRPGEPDAEFIARVDAVAAAGPPASPDRRAARVALIEAGISLATMAVAAGAILAAARYGPQLAAAARGALAFYRGRGADPSRPVSELDISEFRATIPRTMDPKQWDNERWGDNWKAR